VPASIIREVPVTPWTLYPSIAEIPTKGFKGIEVEAIAIEKDHGGQVYCTRLVFSPEDGPLRMCSVYLREEGGGAVCIADLPTKEEALDYALTLAEARRWPVNGSIWQLRIREVPGKGYVADPRESEPFTFDPAKAALYHLTIATKDLFVGGPAEHGHWIPFAGAGIHCVDRAAEKDALLTRVFNAAVSAMGTSAPAAGSLESTRMREMLKDVVEANRSHRLMIFDEAQRDMICELLEEDRFAPAMHESDEGLCGLLLSARPGDLFEEITADFEFGLLEALVSEPGVAAIEAAIAASPEVLGAAMLPEIQRRLERHAIDSPFSHHFADAERDAAQAPRS
jgi:hypothetical protein